MSRLLLSLGGLAAVFEGAAAWNDASALVQSAVRAHKEGSARRSSSGLGRLLDASFSTLGRRVRQAAAKPRPFMHPSLSEELDTEQYDIFAKSTGSITFSRDATAEEEGAFVVLTANRAGCDECPFGWGDKVELLSVIHVPTTVQKGDTVAVTVKMALDVANVNDPLSTVFMGDTYTMTGQCDVCDGSCHLASVKQADSFAVTFPTLIQGSDVCKGKEPRANLTDVVLTDRSMLLPPVDMAWLQMSGHVNISMSMMREERALASTSVSLAFKPEGGSPEATVEKGRESTALAAGDQEVPGLLQVAIDSLFSGEGEEEEIAIEDADADSLKAELLGDLEADPKVASVNTIISGVVVHELENPSGRNISFGAGGGNCWGASRLGSLSCMMKFGEERVFSSHMHLSSVLDQGSYMLLSVTPKVSGIMAQFWRTHIERFSIQDFELPLCGESVHVQINGNYKLFQPPPCGLYSFDLDVPGKQMILSSAAIATPAFRMYKTVVPGLSLNFALLPPMTLNFRAKLFHYGARPIADIEFTMGLDKTV